MRERSSTARLLAWAAVAAQPLFVAAWIVAGALEPSYSHLEQGVSELGADTAANPALGSAALVLLGLSIVALAPALLAVLPRRPAAWVAAALFALAGAALVLGGLLPLDCGMSSPRCEALFDAGRLSAQHDGHLWAALAFQVLLALTPFALARALWPGPVAATLVVAGSLGVVLGALAFLGVRAEDAGGLAQRAGWLLVHAWVVLVAGGVLYATRRAPRPGPVVPLRPREFFASEWEGHGELLVRPFFLGRLMAQRFEGTRRCTFMSERVWRVDDEARLGDGRAQRRTMYCELVDDDRVALTGGDLPDGAEVRLEEGGFRVVPFRMYFPLGPLPVPIRCHDRSYVEADGTLVNVTDAHALGIGLPLSRLTFRVKPL